MRRLCQFLNVGLVAGVLTVGGGAAEIPARIQASVDDSQTFVLKGNTRPVVARGVAQDLGEATGWQVMPRMSVHFKMTAAQRADLVKLLGAQQDRKSAQFHKFLTPEEYAARFGLNSADMQKVTRWVESAGFAGVRVARSGTWVIF
jgi:hypothetical protein